jgi:predicted dehydrogenase
MSNRATWVLSSLVRFPDAKVVALCDRLPGKCAWMAQEYRLGDVPAFGSVTELLKRVECDAVMVMTADAHHAEVVVPALRAGKFVFCEKPLETTIAKCRRIVAADAAAGGKTFIGLNLRYAPVYATLKQRILAGDVGRVLTIQADEFYDGGRTYFRRWNRWRKEGGGLWITKASHDFDIITWLAGARPLSVSAMAARSYYVPKPEAGMQCRACAIAENCPDRMPATWTKVFQVNEQFGGAPADLCLYNSGSDTFDHGIANVQFEGDIFATYTCNVVAGFTERRMRISGTKGTLDATLGTPNITLHKRDPSAVVGIDVTDGNATGGHGGADDLEFREFIEFVQGRAEPRCRPREASIAVGIGLAATRASDTGKTVPLTSFLPATT